MKSIIVACLSLLLLFPHSLAQSQTEVPRYSVTDLEDFLGLLGIRRESTIEYLQEWFRDEVESRYPDQSVATRRKLFEFFDPLMVDITDEILRQSFETTKKYYSPEEITAYLDDEIRRLDNWSSFNRDMRRIAQSVMVKETKIHFERLSEQLVMDEDETERILKNIDRADYETRQ